MTPERDWLNENHMSVPLSGPATVRGFSNTLGDFVVVTQGPVTWTLHESASAISLRDAFAAAVDLLHEMEAPAPEVAA